MFQYFNLETGETFDVDNPRYVNCEDGIWRQCTEQDAQCVSFNGKLFSLANKEVVEGAPDVVAVKKVDAAQKISQINFDSIKNAQNIDEVKAAINDITEAVLDIYLNGL